MDSMLLIIFIIILGPLIGSLIGVVKRPSELFMYNMLAFAAGVMLSISFLELIPESINFSSIWICCAGIIMGTAAMYGLDKIVPHFHPELYEPEQGCRLKRASVYLFLGIFLHNFPEGMVMAVGTVIDFRTVLVLATAIAIHNIPEGICTSAPLYHYTGKRLRSFLLSFSTAIPEILGFVLALLIFQNIPTAITGLIIGATAGIMIYISGDELIPVACNKNGKKIRWCHSTIFSLMIGVLLVILLGLI